MVWFSCWVVNVKGVFADVLIGLRMPVTVQCAKCKMHGWEHTEYIAW